jgi:peptidoglycan-associated lipoprotein
LKKFFLILGVVALLAGCGSSVKLDDVPVEDKSGMAVQQPAGDASGSSVGKGGVTGVDIGQKSPPVDSPAGPRMVYFDYDSFVVKPEFQAVIEANARYIRAEKSRRVAVEGHTDERGGREYNLALGQKRAESVRKALALLGVADAQIEAVSFGKEKPLVLGADEGAMAKNRRAEIHYR